MNNYTLRISKDLQDCNLSDKHYVVTGGTSGAGLATVQFLAERGAHVITCGRDVARGEAELSSLPEDVRKRIILWKMDLIDLSSVKEFADKVIAKWDQLDGLVNNAGVMLPSKTFVMIKDKKYDVQFMTNHVGHFYLTDLLLPLLIKKGNGRIVNVSSVAHDRVSLGGKTFDGHIHFEDIHCRERQYDDGQYHQSKLANLLHAKNLLKYTEKKAFMPFRLIQERSCPISSVITVSSRKCFLRSFSP
jgi:retinol dehydrogenase-13